jgi:hypothetical protein
MYRIYEIWKIYTDERTVDPKTQHKSISTDSCIAFQCLEQLSDILI